MTKSSFILRFIAFPPTAVQRAVSRSMTAEQVAKASCPSFDRKTIIYFREACLRAKTPAGFYSLKVIKSRHDEYGGILPEKAVLSFQRHLHLPCGQDLLYGLRRLLDSTRRILVDSALRRLLQFDRA